MVDCTVCIHLGLSIPPCCCCTLQPSIICTVYIHLLLQADPECTTTLNRSSHITRSGLKSGSRAAKWAVEGERASRVRLLCLARGHPFKNLSICCVDLAYRREPLQQWTCGTEARFSHPLAARVESSMAVLNSIAAWRTHSQSERCLALLVVLLG